jgi:cell division protein FtsQ
MTSAVGNVLPTPPPTPTVTGTPSSGPSRRRLALAPIATFAVLVVVLLEGPALLRMSGLTNLLPQWSIESVSVTGDLYQVSREELTTAITEAVDTDFFGIDVGMVRDVALQVPWVEEVSVRKVWPGKLHVQVRERRPAARWQAGGLIDVKGAPFSPGQGKDLKQLAILNGPDGTQAEMLERLRVLTTLVAPLGQRISVLRLDRASGWRIELESGLTLVAGHDIDDASLGRLARQLQAALGSRFADAARIDLRYANGFAVRFKDAPLKLETDQ